MIIRNLASSVIFFYTRASLLQAGWKTDTSTSSGQVTEDRSNAIASVGHPFQ